MKLSLVEEYSSVYTAFLVGGGGCLALLHSSGEPFICEPVPLPKAGAACFGKAFAGERPQAGPGSSLAPLLLPGKGGGWGLGTADGSVRQECVYIRKSWGLGRPGADKTKERKACPLTRKLPLIRWVLCTLLCCDVWELGNKAGVGLLTALRDSGSRLKAHSEFTERLMAASQTYWNKFRPLNIGAPCQCQAPVCVEDIVLVGFFKF